MNESKETKGIVGAFRHHSGRKVSSVFEVVSRKSLKTKEREKHRGKWAGDFID